jgi:hypothetical protein
VIFVHIGTHKTGTTSIQRYLLDNASALASAGYDRYQGIFPQANHIELHLACLRDDCESFARLRLRGTIVFDDAYRLMIRDRVRGFLGRSTLPHQLLSNEGLSWLRYPAEMKRLRDVLCEGGSCEGKVNFVLFLRNRQDFLQSYRAQILKVPGRVESDDPASALYARDDTWVADFDGLIEAYRQGFPEATFSIIDYDFATQRDGSVIPAYLRAIGLDPARMPPWQDYHLNRSAPG